MKSYDLASITKKIYNSSVTLFTLKTLKDISEIDKISSLFKVINRLIISGILKKIERNKYILKDFSGSEFKLANFIYEPSYISFESALSYYGVLSQFPYEITSATIKQTKLKKLNDKQLLNQCQNNLFVFLWRRNQKELLEIFLSVFL